MYSSFALDAFNLLNGEANGSRARALAEFLVLYQVEIAFTPTNALGFVLVEDRRTIYLSQTLAQESWPAAEIAAVLAHETHHVIQGTIERQQDRSPIYWLEDVEGPAYVVETLVWDELRRDDQGAITITNQHVDWDFRANSFINPDGTVDVAAHNAYISSDRGIPPNVQLW